MIDNDYFFKEIKKLNEDISKLEKYNLELRGIIHNYEIRVADYEIKLSDSCYLAHLNIMSSLNRENEALKHEINKLKDSNEDKNISIYNLRCMIGLYQRVHGSIKDTHIPDENQIVGEMQCK